MAHYLRLAKWVHPTPEHYVLLRDPQDSEYLNLAVEAAAPNLVSDAKDLLDLMDAASVSGCDRAMLQPNS